MGQGHQGGGHQAAIAMIGGTELKGVVVARTRAIFLTSH